MRLRLYFPVSPILIIIILFLSGSSANGQVPVANFTASPLAGCSPVVVNFQDLSSGNPTAWSWDFGNGNTSALQNPTASYLTPGSYNVTLKVTNNNGTNTLVRSQYVVVYDAPAVSFSASQTTGCFPLRVQFTDNSNAGAGNSSTGWLWDFGDGTISTEQNPLHVYTISGNFTVTLRVTNDKGCYRVLTTPNYIQTLQGMTTGFTNTQPAVCQPPATVTFTNNSTGPGTLSYQWNFGDGNTSTAVSPVYTYTTPGLFGVSLIVISSTGCTDTLIKNNLVPVGVYNPSFAAPDSVCLNIPATFNDTSSPVPTSRTWDFGDGTTSTAVNPVKAYSAPGIYTIKMVTNYGTCADSVSKNITVVDNPVADFTAPVTARCQAPLTVNFQNQSINAVSWQWNFGDGATSTDQNPVHDYTAEGNYDVTLIATNAFGCGDTIVKPAFVKIARPIITIPSLPAAGCIPFTINPVANVNAVDAVVSYLWDFGDGTTSTLQNPSHTYPVQGNFNITLTITTSTGCTETLLINNAIRVGTLPTADFSATPIPVCAVDPVQFTNLSSTTDAWLWNFGDGTTSSAQNPSHTYLTTGTFTISLTSINNGCPATATKAAYVVVRPPIARFDVTPNCANRLQFSFTDQSLGPVTSWLWNFGDGTTSTLQNPVHVFPALGNYNVTLTATTVFAPGDECTYSLTRTVRAIDENPDFSVNPNPGCKEYPTLMKALVGSYPNIATYNWDFGDGSNLVTSADLVAHTYIAAGNYSVRLITTDINGCLDTIIKTNFVRINGPTANFSATNRTGCQGLNVSFTDLSTTDGINAITNWRWDFGDGTIQSFAGAPFQHIYDSVGTYPVKLTVTDASGCTDSLTIAALITTTDPLPDFVSRDTLTCPGATAVFTNTTVADNFTSLWNFGDGTTSSVVSPSHAFATPGFYDIKLQVTDQYGCIDSVIKTAYIRVDTPFARFNISDSISSCTPFEVQFRDSSLYYTSLRWNFGDGGISTQVDPVHYYGLPGTFQVSLTATSPGGCTSVAYKTIEVYDTVGSYVNYSPLSGCNPQGVSFSAFTPGPVTYLWDFGDGYTETTTIPSSSHVFTLFGDFVPRVIMEDPSGCLIPVLGMDTIHITGSNAKFGMDTRLLCDSGYISFIDSTTFNDPITNWTWNFGDGQTSSVQNPVHYYSSTGFYTVSLGIQTQSGCSSSFTLTDTIKVVQSPLIGITGDSVACIYSGMDQQGVFLRTDTSAVTWNWIFPNGNTSTLNDPPGQFYDVAGNFIITAIATNSSGCRDTATKNIVVNPLPVSDMPGTITILSGESITIPATYSPNTATWLWGPNTGLSCTNCPQPVATPRFSTTYKVSFVDSNGCRNTDTISLVVVCRDGNIFIPNTFSPNGDGSNDKFYPRGKGIDRMQVLRIFNRWGEVVYEKINFPVNDASYGWDGTFKGKPPQPDVYIFQAEVYCSNGELIKFAGNVSLIQ